MCALVMRRRRLLVALAAVVVLVVGGLWILLDTEARRYASDSLGWLQGNDRTKQRKAEPFQTHAELLIPKSVGLPTTGHPRVCSVTIADLDQDGLRDILVCDALANRVGWIRQDSSGAYAERWVGPVLRAPARVDALDVDQDRDLDLLVAVLGELFPTNDKLGSIVILENDGHQNFAPHVIVERVARVADVRGGDFDSDGDVDLIAAQFGYFEGETRWLENLGHWKFRSHLLQSLAGPIHAIPTDVDGDRDLDILSLVSQEWEEIYVFENDGTGSFHPRLLWGSTNDDFGSSGMVVIDLDRDRDKDVLFTNGDAFDYIPPRPRPWHGVQWLENNDGQFVYRRIGDLHGASAACAADVDGDEDLDVVAVTAWNLWENPAAPSMVWFENDGDMNFKSHYITNTPTHLIALEADDMNRDGRVDFVTGGMHVYHPYTRQSRITLWLNSPGPSRPVSR